MAGVYDVGDQFEPYTSTNPHADEQINDFDLCLVPAGATDLFEAVALSVSPDGTVEHIFHQIQTTGMYEIWVHKFDIDLGSNDYALAWWGVTLPGDFDGDGTVDREDYDQWKTDYGTDNLASDGNGDGLVNAADYTVWRNNLGAMLGAGSTLPANVPEPHGLLLLIVGLVGLFQQRRVVAWSSPEQACGD
jgi:hypothetical protein